MIPRFLSRLAEWIPSTPYRGDPAKRKRPLKHAEGSIKRLQQLSHQPCHHQKGKWRSKREELAFMRRIKSWAALPDSKEAPWNMLSSAGILRLESTCCNICGRPQTRPAMTRPRTIGTLWVKILPSNLRAREPGRKTLRLNRTSKDHFNFPNGQWQVVQKNKPSLP